MGLHASRAVVSNTMRMSNSSKLVSLITERYGLVKVMAKGARRPTSRYGAALEPVTVIETIYYHKDGREIQTLSSADIIEPFPRIKSDMLSFCTASAMVESAQMVTAPEDQSSGTFPVLVEALAGLERSDDADLDKHLWRFMLRLVAAAGYRPALDRCAVCGKRPKTSSVFFSFQDGGLICPCTDTAQRYGFWISPGSLMVMKVLMSSHEDELPRIGIGSRQRREVGHAVHQFFAYHTGTSRQPRALSFIKKLEAYEREGDRPERSDHGDSPLDDSIHDAPDTHTSSRIREGEKRT